MKKYLLLAIFICGCTYSERKARAHHAAEQYVKDFLNPHGLETVSFGELQRLRRMTALDSSLNYAHINANDSLKVKKYIDSENFQRPDRAPANIREADSIAQGKLFYYSLTYIFKVDSAGHKKMMRYHFELDTGFRVLNAVDVTNNHNQEF
jgi:hypothetical protein